MKHSLWKLVFLAMLGILLIGGSFNPASAQAQTDQAGQGSQTGQGGQDENAIQGDQRGTDEGQYGYHTRFKWWERPNVIQKLKLTDDQLTRIRKIYDGQSENIEKLHSELRAQGKKLRELMVQEKLDDTQINQQIDTVATSFADLMKAKLQLNAKIIGELSQEQRTELIAMYEQMRERMMKKWGRKTQEK